MATKTDPVSVILDTDMLTDCDDAGALAMLHRFADLGEAAILGVLLNGYDTNEKHGAVVSAINHYFERPEIPIGISPRPPQDSPSKPSSYSSQIFAEFAHDGKLDSERPDAVARYRELLKGQPDHSVVIISIGFLTNLCDLINSPGGRELLADKVKYMSIMGGAYPSGKEYNFAFDKMGTVTQQVISNWPKSVPMVFTGFELGERIVTGTAYKHAPPSPMKRAYELAYDSINKGRPSWDQLSVLYGVRGKGYQGKTYFSMVKGQNHIDPDGTNQWDQDGAGNHAYLQNAMLDEELSEVVEELMLKPVN